MALEAFKYERGNLLVLDQIKLPHKHEYIQVSTVEEGWKVINEMQVIPEEAKFFLQKTFS